MKYTCLENNRLYGISGGHQVELHYYLYAYMYKLQDMGSDGDVAPLLPNYQPAPYPATPHMPPATMSQQATNNTTVVEMQPMGGQPQIVQVPPRQANDHLWLTMALMFLCLVLCCNGLGALCLMPGLICAALVSYLLLLLLLNWKCIISWGM